jgi:hypothetical protein
LVSSEEYMVMNNVCGNEGQYSDGRSEYLAEDDTPSLQCNTLLGYDYKIRVAQTAFILFSTFLDLRPVSDASD